MTQEWVEELDRRNRTSKTNRLYVDGQPTNSFRQDLSTAAVHYKDAADEWQDIETDLVPGVESIVGFGDAPYEMIENGYEMFVLDYLRSGDPIIHCRGKLDGHYVQFSAQDPHCDLSPLLLQYP
jgi:hypothetical protein